MFSKLSVLQVYFCTRDKQGSISIHLLVSNPYFRVAFLAISGTRPGLPKLTQRRAQRLPLATVCGSHSNEKPCTSSGRNVDKWLKLLAAFKQQRSYWK